MKIIYILALSCFLCGADVIKTFRDGKTYQFAENDMLTEIQNTIQNNRPELEQKLTEMKKESKVKIKNYKPKDMITMTPALKDNIFYPDMTYTNPDNIYDNNGKLLYPKGFTFNPLDFQTMHTQMIIIDGSSLKEVQWIQDNGYTNNMRYKILLSNGNYQQVSKILKQPVFYCIAKISQKFQLKHTPSIVTQIGNSMEVREICIKCQKEKKLNE